MIGVLRKVYRWSGLRRLFPSLGLRVSNFVQRPLSAAPHAAGLPNAADDTSASQIRPSASASARPLQPPLPISVVIPTFNRGELLSRTLDSCLRLAIGMEVEFIVIDDGSTDDTPRRLADIALQAPNLRWRSIAKSGPGQARNLGASLARHDVVLFMGDDIQPVDGDFFRTHGAMHAANPTVDIAVLGKVIWPDNQRGFVNFVMSHIQGHGGEQFGYADLVPYTDLDWRFFYTANVSVMKAVVGDWETDGFDGRFNNAAWEDIEFAYRLKKKSQEFRVFYDPTSVAAHHHRYAAEQFIERQMSVGSMAQVFFAKHPDAAKPLGFDVFIGILNKPTAPESQDTTSEYHSIIEGLKSYVRLLDETGALGTQVWHDALLAAVFDLTVYQAFVLSWARPNGNHAAALEYSLGRFRQTMRREAQIHFGLHL